MSFLNVIDALVLGWYVSEERARNIVGTITITGLTVDASTETQAQYYAELAGLEQRTIDPEDVAYMDDET